jgi:hypothetical protein
MNTDFQAVFDKILEVALDSNLAPAKMVRRVLVFSAVRPAIYLIVFV